MCFGRVPPEINSARLFCGAGSASMAHAAMAWDGLSGALRRAADSCCAVTTGVAVGWQMPAALALTGAVAPFIVWLNAAADAAANTATQAEAAVDAYETVLRAMVHPDVVTANRAHRDALRATNCLAQLAPAIANADAEYERMWVQAARVMYAYAQAAAKATELTAFGSPALHVEPPVRAQSDVSSRQQARRLAAAPELFGAGRTVMTTIPQALRALSSSAWTTVDVYLESATPALSKMCALSWSSVTAIQYVHAMNRTMLLMRATAQPSRSPQHQSESGLGCAGAIGILTVPGRWLELSAESEPVEGDWAWVRESREPLRLVQTTVAHRLEHAQTPRTGRGE